MYRGINEINPRTEEKTTLVALVHEFFFLRLLRNVYYTYTCIYIYLERLNITLLLLPSTIRNRANRNYH